METENVKLVAFNVTKYKQSSLVQIKSSIQNQPFLHYKKTKTVFYTNMEYSIWQFRCKNLCFAAERLFLTAGFSKPAVDVLVLLLWER